jgi:aspartate racemase
MKLPFCHRVAGFPLCRIGGAVKLGLTGAMTDRILGVLGGMGPLASAHFMTRLTLLTPAERDQDHIPAILWSDPRIPDRGSALRGEGPDPLPALLRGIDGLQAAGCGAIVIPCNTAHGWYDRMAAHASVKILHIADAAASELRRKASPGARVGVLGTQATLDMRLYQNRLARDGWDVIAPSAQEMAELVMPAIRMVKANQVAEAYAPLARAIADLAANGAQAVVLGCTELPLAYLAGPGEAKTGAVETPLVDTIDALALAAIDWARNQ